LQCSELTVMHDIEGMCGGTTFQLPRNVKDSLRMRDVD